MSSIGRNAFTFLMVIALGFLSFQEAVAATPRRGTFRSGGYDREYYLYVPDNLKKDSPLVVVLHGYSLPYPSTPKTLNAIADTAGFVVCYPQGLKDSSGRNFWNVGYPIHRGMKVDDVKFVCDLADSLRRSMNLGKAFLTGFSNGGDMCYLTGFRSRGTFSGYAAVAGTFMKAWYRYRPTATPTPFMEIHGTKDGPARWNGDPDGLLGWGKYLSTREAVSLWTRLDGCSIGETEPLPRKGPHVVLLHRFTSPSGLSPFPGEKSPEVRLYEVVDAGHGWHEEDLDTFREIWLFFREYR